MRFIFLAIIILSISACGFKPMLAKDSEGHRILDEVKLSKVGGPDKLRLERIILESFNPHPHSAPLYNLNIQVSYSNTSMAILKDSQTTRYRVKVNLNYSLLDAETHKEIDKGNLYLYSSYDVADSEFMNYVAERYVSENILRELSEELKNRLNLVLTTRSAIEK